MLSGCVVWGCVLTGHGNGDVSRSSGRGLRVGGAERLQADGRLVAVAQRRPLAARCLTDAQTLHIQHHTVHAGKTGLRTGGQTEETVIRRTHLACLLLCMSAMTHHDAESFEDVEFTHGTGAVLIQPGVNTHFMEDMSADRQRHISSDEILSPNNQHDRTENGSSVKSSEKIKLAA